MTLSQFKAQLSLQFNVLGSQKIALSHPQILRVVNAKDEETVRLGPKNGQIIAIRNRDEC
jgi:hypothetical protein